MLCSYRGGPKNIKTGDLLCILYSGGPVFALRYEQGSNVATLVEDCYVDGCMDLDLLPREALRGRGAVRHWLNRSGDPQLPITSGLSLHSAV